MLALWIIGGVLVFLLILLLSPVFICFDYEGEELRLSVRYLFLWIKILPVPKRKTGASPEKARRVAKEKTEKKEARLRDNLATSLEMLHASRRALQIIRRGVSISRLKLLLSVGGADAHTTAENYGRIAAAVFPLMEAITRLVTVREPSLYMAPNFLSGKTVCEVSIRVRLIPLSVLAAAGHVGFKFVKILTRHKRSGQDIKGGKKYERKTSHQ